MSLSEKWRSTANKSCRLLVNPEPPDFYRLGYEDGSRKMWLKLAPWLFWGAAGWLLWLVSLVVLWLR